MSKDWNRKKNDLTWSLFWQGYNPINFPDYAKWVDYLYEFEYTNKYLGSLVFVTGCGLLVKGDHFLNGYMSYMGVDWRAENNNPVINCPYRKSNCEKNHPLLRKKDNGEGGLCIICNCVCHQTEDSFDYEKSLDKAYDDIDKEIEKKYQQFVKQKKGYVCRNHAHYNEHTGKWNMIYDPDKCAGYHCSGVCELRKVEISSKKGNVYYDCKVTSVRHDGTIFEGEKIVSIEKGKRYLEHPCSITICEEIVKHNQTKILEHNKMKLHRELFFHPEMTVEILNIRAESRESRDLMQDLEDIKAGISITHESDQLKAKKEDKSARRMKRAEQRILRLERKIIRHGLDNLDICDRRRVDKLIGKSRLNEIVKEANKKKVKASFTQMDLEDLFTIQDS